MQDSIYTLIRKNQGLALIAINLALAVTLFFQSNPFGLFATGYAAADPLLDVSQGDVQKIVIRDPDFNAGPDDAQVVLSRGDRLARAQWSVQPDENAWFDRVDPEYRWHIEIREGERVRKYAADPERVADLFNKGLAEARRHHYVPRSPEKDRDLQMNTDSAGRYDGLSLQFELTNGKSHTIYVGRSSLRGNQSYLRLDQESEIYLAETNLRSVAGPGEIDYFRNRRLVPRELGSADVTAIHAAFPGDAVPVSLVKDGGVWRLQSPPIPGKVRAEQIDQLVSDIVGWKAVAFPEVGNAAALKALNFETRAPFPFSLRVLYRAEGNLTDRNELVFEVLGRKNFSNYLVRTADGELAEVSSVFLEDLLNPREKFLDSGAGRPAGL